MRIFLLLAVIGLILGGCGEKSKSRCEVALDAFDAGQAAACVGKVCCFCACLDEGLHMEWGSTYEDCQCVLDVDFDPDPEQEGDDCSFVMAIADVEPEDPDSMVEGKCWQMGFDWAEHFCSESSP